MEYFNIVATGIICICSVIVVNIVAKMLVKDSEDQVRNSKLRGRVEQLREFTENNAIKSKIEDYVTDTVKYDERKKLEQLIKQSGIKIGIADLYIMGIASALGLAVLSYAVLKNIFISFIMIVVGVMLPKQIITLIRNKRVKMLDVQIGTFLRMVIKRYHVLNNFPEAMKLTLGDFVGEEPLCSEIKKTIADIDLGCSVGDALDDMGKRTANKYIKLLANNYKASVDIGTQEMREKLLDAVVKKYDKDYMNKSKLKREINGPVFEGFLIMLIVPAAFLMQASFDSTYVDFMLNNWMGKVSMAAVAMLLSLSSWIIVNKVGAPLDGEDD